MLAIVSAPATRVGGSPPSVQQTFGGTPDFILFRGLSERFHSSGWPLRQVPLWDWRRATGAGGTDMSRRGRCPTRRPPRITGTSNGSVPAGPGSSRVARHSSRIGKRRQTCLAPGSVAFPVDSLSTGRSRTPPACRRCRARGASPDTPIWVPTPAASIGIPSTRNRSRSGLVPCSRRRKSSQSRIADLYEDETVRIRKKSQWRIWRPRL